MKRWKGYKSLNVLSPTLGMRRDEEATVIDKRYSPNLSNVRFSAGAVTKRKGYSTLGTKLTSNQIMLVDEYKKFAGTKYTIAADIDDVYYWDNTNWQYINRSYTTGTVTIANGSPTLEGAGGTVWTTNATAGDKVLIAGDATWYTISTVDDDDTITLSTNKSGAATAVTYRIRHVYTGAITNHFDWTFMNDLFILTNGVDTIRTWSGTGNMADLGGATTYKCKKIVEYKDHLCLLNTIEGGVSYQQGFRWCNLGDPTDWSGGDSGAVDLTNSPGQIMDCAKYGDSIIVIKETSVDVITYVAGLPVFRIDTVITGIGSPAYRTAAATPVGVVFLGWDNIWLYTGGTYFLPIGEPIREYLFGVISMANVATAWGLYDDTTHIYELHVPTNATTPDLRVACDLRNIGRGGQAIWLKDIVSFTAGGLSETTTDMTWGDLEDILGAGGAAITWNEFDHEDTWGDLASGATPKKLVYGATNGQVYQVPAVAALNDNAATITTYFDSCDYSALDVGGGGNGFDEYIRCNGLAFTAKGNSVTVQYNIESDDPDDTANWTTIETVTLNDDYTTHRVFCNITSRRLRFRFRNATAGSTFYLRSFAPNLLLRSER